MERQSKLNNSTNTKTFPEIWKTLNSDERDALTIKFYQKKCCKTRQAVFYWATGQRVPASPLVRDVVADLVSKAIGEKVYARTLFPEKS